VTLPSFSATVLTTPKPHGLTMVELRVVYQIAGWLKDRCSPAAVIKRNPLPKTTDAEAPIPSELGITTALVLPLASLGHISTSPSLPSIPFLAKQAVLPSSSPTSRRSSE
jgi:hypothetical protein